MPLQRTLRTRSRSTRSNLVRKGFGASADQRDAVSGVDLNQEATRMLVFERMFQSMARFLNTVARTQETLMTMM